MLQNIEIHEFFPTYASQDFGAVVQESSDFVVFEQETASMTGRQSLVNFPLCLTNFSLLLMALRGFWFSGLKFEIWVSILDLRRIDFDIADKQWRCLRRMAWFERPDLHALVQVAEMSVVSSENTRGLFHLRVFLILSRNLVSENGLV